MLLTDGLPNCNPSNRPCAPMPRGFRQLRRDRRLPPDRVRRDRLRSIPFDGASASTRTPGQRGSQLECKGVDTFVIGFGKDTSAATPTGC